MFSDLAWKNVRRSLRDYGVWFLTIAFGVCLFYVFNALETQTVLRFLAQNPKTGIVEAIQRLIGVLSVFVWAVLAFLILYASGFLVRRRKGELGTYLLLGLSHGQVSRLLVLETGVIGLISLAVGLVLGVAASWVLSTLTLSMFQMNMSGLLGLRFSLPAAGRTVFCFGLIFLLVSQLWLPKIVRLKMLRI